MPPPGGAARAVTLARYARRGFFAGGSNMTRLLAAAVLLSFAAAAPAQLGYLGQQTLPTGYMFSGTVVGGLSGIDRDPASGLYWAISDDRSQTGAARFYNLSLDLSLFQRSNSPGSAGVLFNTVETMKTPGGTTYATLTVDPESIRLNPATGNLAWTSEGDRGLLINPFARQMTTTGAFVNGFAVPGSFHMYETEQGSRNNLALESLTFSVDGARLYTATENALYQDGPATGQAGVTSVARILAFDSASRAPVAQYAYRVDAVAIPPSGPTDFSTNGLVEMLAVTPTEFIAIERSFTASANRNTIRLYLASLAGATDVSGVDSLAGAAYTPVSKTLLLDLDTLRNADGSPVVLDNIEGITWGPTLANGNRTLVLVSDNNFSATQFTQFIALEATTPIPEPSAYALLLAGLALVGFTGRRGR
jgi:hypothetical protein